MDDRFIQCLKTRKRLSMTVWNTTRSAIYIEGGSLK